MISQKQLTANRINAQKGGVKTEEGKTISKYNAIKHGLISEGILLKSENHEELVSFADRLKTSLNPKNELEQVLVDRIISNFWRLKRAMRIEQEMINNDCEKTNFFGRSGKQNIGTAFQVDFINHDTYRKLTKYETSIERGIYKALHELQRIQSGRTKGGVPAVMAIDLIGS